MQADRPVRSGCILPNDPSAGEPFEIRSFTPADLDRVMAIERQGYTHPWSPELFLEEARNPFSSLDLLWLRGELAGYLCSWLLCGELHILNVATAPASRRRGVAATLLRHVLDRACGQGLSRAFLEVRVGNTGAIELYRRFGFRLTYRRPRYYPDGEDAFVMEWSADVAAFAASAGEKRNV